MQACCEEFYRFLVHGHSSSVMLVVAVPQQYLCILIDLISKNRIECDLVEDCRIWLG